MVAQFQAIPWTLLIQQYCNKIYTHYTSHPPSPSHSHSHNSADTDAKKIALSASSHRKQVNRINRIKHESDTLMNPLIHSFIHAFSTLLFTLLYSIIYTLFILYKYIETWISLRYHLYIMILQRGNSHLSFRIRSRYMTEYILSHLPFHNTYMHRSIQDECSIDQMHDDVLVLSSHSVNYKKLPKHLAFTIDTSSRLAKAKENERTATDSIIHQLSLIISYSIYVEIHEVTLYDNQSFIREHVNELSESIARIQSMWLNEEHQHLYQNHRAKSENESHTLLLKAQNIGQSRIIIRVRRRQSRSMKVKKSRRETECMMNDDDTGSEIGIVEKGVIHPGKNTDIAMHTNNGMRISSNVGTHHDNQNNRDNNNDNASLFVNSEKNHAVDANNNTYIINILSSESGHEEMIHTLRDQMRSRKSLNSLESSLASSSNFNQFHQMMMTSHDGRSGSPPCNYISYCSHNNHGGVNDQDMVSLLPLPPMTEPQMLVCIGSTPSVYSFPGWLLRIVEIFHVHHLDDINPYIYSELLQGYGQTTQRNGT